MLAVVRTCQLAVALRTTWQRLEMSAEDSSYARHQSCVQYHCLGGHVSAVGSCFACLLCTTRHFSATERRLAAPQQRRLSIKAWLGSASP
eukprot:321511-Amphidinium_carterae.2